MAAAVWRQRRAERPRSCLDIGQPMGVCRQVNEEEQETLRRWWRAPEYWLLVAAMLVSMLGVAWWIVVPLTLAGLSVSSLPKYIGLWPRAERAGAQAEWWKTVGLSTFNSFAAAVAAFLFGNVLRWLWW